MPQLIIDFLRQLYKYSKKTANSSLFRALIKTLIFYGLFLFASGVLLLSGGDSATFIRFLLSNISLIGYLTGGLAVSALVGTSAQLLKYMEENDFPDKRIVNCTKSTTNTALLRTFPIINTFADLFYLLFLYDKDAVTTFIGNNHPAIWLIISGGSSILISIPISLANKLWRDGSVKDSSILWLKNQMGDAWYSRMLIKHLNNSESGPSFGTLKRIDLGIMSGLFSGTLMLAIKDPNNIDAGYIVLATTITTAGIVFVPIASLGAEIAARIFGSYVDNSYAWLREKIKCEANIAISAEEEPLIPTTTAPKITSTRYPSTFFALLDHAKHNPIQIIRLLALKLVEAGFNCASITLTLRTLWGLYDAARDSSLETFEQNQHASIAQALLLVLTEYAAQQLSTLDLEKLLAYLTSNTETRNNSIEEFDHGNLDNVVP